jgi:hypothetical protein
MEGPIAKWYTIVRQRDQELGTVVHQVSEILPAGGRILEVAPGPGYLAIAIYLLEREARSSACSTNSAQRIYERHWTPVHLDFVVDNIERATGKAMRFGAKIDKPMTSHAWGKIAVLADPFGNGFCLIEFIGRGYDELVGRGKKKSKHALRSADCARLN